MRILITSGGTKVPIDPVRDISNKSRGTFASNLATAALQYGHKVIYLCADDAKSPFSINFDLYRSQDQTAQLASLTAAQDFANRYRSNYDEHRFRNYLDYANLLERTIKDDQPKIVVLAAAVSDYLVLPLKQKIRSGGDMTVQLEPAAKLISLVKRWHPGCVLCGFKMLVDATDDELLAAAWESVVKNNCDMVVSNDLLSVQRRSHEILMVEPTYYFDAPGEPPIVQKVTDNLANTVMAKLIQLAEGTCTTSS